MKHLPIILLCLSLIGCAAEPELDIEFSNYANPVEEVAYFDQEDYILTINRKHIKYIKWPRGQIIIKFEKQEIE